MTLRPLLLIASLVTSGAVASAPSATDRLTTLSADIERQYTEALTSRLCDPYVFRDMGASVMGAVPSDDERAARQEQVDAAVGRLDALCRTRVGEALGLKSSPYLQFKSDIRSRLEQWPRRDLDALENFRATSGGARYAKLLDELDAARVHDLGPWLNEFARSLYGDLQLALRAEVGPVPRTQSEGRAPATTPSLPPARLSNMSAIGELCEGFYPALSRRLGEEGLVVLYVRLDATGQLLGVHLGESSGHPDLDVATAACVGKHARFEPPPKAAPGGSWFQVRWNWRLGEP